MSGVVVVSPKRKTIDIKSKYLIILFLAFLFWYDIAVNKAQTSTGMIFAVGSLAIIGCNMMDMFQKKITKRVNNVDIGSYPLDTPPQTTTAKKIYGKIYSGLKVDIGYVQDAANFFRHRLPEGFELIGVTV